MVYSNVSNFIEDYGNTIEEDKIEFYLKKASREMDKYLIVKPISLSDYEKQIFEYVCNELALFIFKNEKYINNVVTSLSIAGTSYSFSNNEIISKQKEILKSLDETQYMNRDI